MLDKIEIVGRDPGHRNPCESPNASIEIGTAQQLLGSHISSQRMARWQREDSERLIWKIFQNLNQIINLGVRQKKKKRKLNYVNYEAKVKRREDIV